MIDLIERGFAGTYSMAADPLLLRTPLDGDAPAGAGETAPHTNPSPALARLRAVLPEELAARVSSGAELVRSRSHLRVDVTPTCVESFDTILGGGLLKGKIVELTARRSTGRFSIAIASLAAVTSTGDLAALIDLGDNLDARSAEDAGVEMERLLWVRPDTTKEAVMSAELLVATGFPLVVIDLGMRLRGRKVADATWIRLARAAESHGTAILVSSPWPVCGTAAAAAVKIEHARPVWLGGGKTPRLLGDIESRMSLVRMRERGIDTREGTTARERIHVAERILVPSGGKVKRPEGALDGSRWWSAQRDTTGMQNNTNPDAPEGRRKEDAFGLNVLESSIPHRFQHQGSLADARIRLAPTSS